ncbi:MAG: hypothetical protein MRJ96_00665 [Nitrospirales bacterium]|nr:hypothetical protein [Nitrospira sp.]MDR4499952.1 hypothetical protein [Nitrospirales bacterium]
MRVLFHTVIVFTLYLMLAGGMGCSHDGRYRDEHILQDLRVVFVDQETLREEWEQHTGRTGIQFTSFHGEHAPQIKNIRGFYDLTTKTLYCSKWNFSVCGHELHHAVLGHFHAEEY